MQLTKVTSFVDLSSLGAEKEAFEKMIEDVVAKLQTVKAINIRLEGAQTAKDAAKIMQEQTKAIEATTKANKDFEKSLLDQAKAQKLAAAAAKEVAAAKKLEAQATNEVAKAGLNEAKQTTEQIRQKQLLAKYEAALAKEKQKLDRLSGAEQKNLERLSNAYEQLKAKYNIAANTAKRLAAEQLNVAAANGLSSKEYKQAAEFTTMAQQAAQKYYLELVKIEDAVGQSQRKVGQYTNATFALTQVLREAPAFAISLQTGISAIGNNLPILFDEFKKLSSTIDAVSGKALGGMKAFKIFAGSMLTFTGLLPIALLLLQAFSGQIATFFSSLFSGKKSFDSFIESQKQLNKALDSSSYKDAVKNVNELKINIDLAKQGFLSKDRVLKQYNESLGNTIGKASSLNEAEQLLVKNGEAYIKMTLYKAAANLSLEEAAKKALEAEQKRLKDAKTFLKGQDNVNALSQNISSTPFGIKSIQDRDKESKNYKASLAEAAKNRKEAAIKTSEDEAQVFEDIAAKFQKKAAETAKNFNLDFFGDDEDKGKKDKRLQDFRKNLEKEIQERQKIQNDITRARLEGQAAEALKRATKEAEVTDKAPLDRNLEILQDSFTERLGAYDEHYAKVQELTEFNTRAELQELEAKIKEEKRLVQETLDDKTQKLTASQRSDLQATLVAIDAKGAAEKQLILEKGNQKQLDSQAQYETDILALSVSTNTAITAALTSALEKQRALRQEDAQSIKGLYDSYFLDRTKQYAEDVIALNNSLTAGKISYAQYLKDRQKLDKDYQKQIKAGTIRFFEDQLVFLKGLDVQETRAKKKLADLRAELSIAGTDAERQALAERIALAEKELKAVQDDIEKKIELENKLHEAKKQLSDSNTENEIKNREKVRQAEKAFVDEVIQLFTTLGTAKYDREKNAIQEQINLLDERTAKELEANDRSTASDQDKANKAIVIQARAAAQKKALEARQKQIDEQRARFERAVEIGRIIASTAVGVTNALSGPPPAPPNPFLAGVIAATGAIQLARVLATPLPKYAEGLDEATSDHWAITGDGGRHEYLRYPDGSGWITPDRPTLTFVPKGSSIDKSLDEAGMLYNQLAPAAAYQPASSTGNVDYLVSTVTSEMKKTRQAILNKKENHWFVNNGQISMKTTDGYNEVTYLNSNLQDK